MEDSPSAIQARMRRERDAYLKGLSDRTRTLCLGSLALIWGILGEKKGEHGLDVSKPWKIILLAIGLSAIIVLVFDFGEFACAYQYRRKAAGEKVVGKRDYRRWEVVMRSAKLRLGVFTLVSLCVVLFSILLSSVAARGQPDYPFKGTWCGDDPYTCLQVEDENGSIEVKVSLSRNDKFTLCDSVERVLGDQMFARCGRAIIRVEDGPNDSTLQLHLEIDDYKDDREISKIPDR